MNNNKSDERALLAGCKGVFNPTSYITIGSKGKPEDYGRQLPDHPRFGGKQFGQAWPKAAKTVDVYFEKQHKWVYSGCKFNDRLMYVVQQKKPSRGFGTSDYKRRDEFTLDFRTEQYREQLHMESKFAKAAMELLKSQNPEAAEHASPALISLGPVEGQDKPFLYDLVYKPQREPSCASKVHRDTENPTMHSKDRKFGNMHTTMRLAHAAPDPTCLAPPEFAHKPIIRDSFYRKTNTRVPDDCVVLNAAEAF